MLKLFALGLLLSGLLPVAESALKTSKIESGQQDAIVRLSSLQSCSLKKRWVGNVPLIRWGTWLVCGDSSYLIVHPWNLVGHVSISQPQQALEYVRLFTSFNTFDMFQLNGMVEVEPESAEWLAALAKSKELSPIFHSPEVKVLAGEASTEKTFQIKRIVVTYEQEVSEIVEVVEEKGFYQVVSQRILLPDIRELGFVHQAP